MAIKTKKISTLIESQIPSFIVDEYPLFSKFVEKYYEAQESSGQPLDIANNLLEYSDINLYEQNLLKENTILDGTITDSDDTIVLQDASSFPEKNGYVRINDEIIFYSTRTDTTLSDCSRGVSGNTTLGDLYEESTFVTTDSAPHNSGSVVHNVSNLFLYALIKSFESQYLASFPEKYLKGDVDKRTLIKNIREFYKTKGTDSSVRFVFNSIVSNTSRDIPETYNPREFTYKSSNSDWINIYALKCKVVSGNPKDLIGTKIVQKPTADYGYADAIVDNVFSDGTADDEQIYNIVLAPETVNGTFGVSTKTKLRKSLSGTAISGDRIDVFSTIGWDLKGSVLIGDETIEFDGKTVDQFIIKKREPTTSLPRAINTPVYRPVVLDGTNVTLLTFGIVYNLLPSDAQPYSAIGDTIQVSNPGFETSDPKIVETGTNTTRWLLNTGASPNVPTLPVVSSSLDGVSTNISAILEDEQYYYIASSSYPSHKILDGSTVNEKVLDQKILRLIRKESIRTTEKYETPKRDVGIALNGVPFYGYKDPESVRYGKLEEIKINTRGTGYSKPPFVLIDQVPNKARAILAGQVVESIVVDTNDVFPRTPDITITSGRNADVSAVVTGGKVTSLVINNSGEFYSAAPLIVIRDAAGRGRFAEYLSIVNTDGEITGFEMVSEGNFYSQDTVIVDVIPVGNGAEGIPLLKEWNFNRFEKLRNKLDTENGYIFQNYNPSDLEYGYGYAANPKALRVDLNDNINNAGSEPSTKIHSPIIGFAYDGNPIYGPFGYEDPLDSTSSIKRMTSGYAINGARSEGPSLTKYPLGSFVNDYTYTHKSGTLDENNGRFCITPDFPKGTYAYFLTIDSDQVPQFPYTLGENFYSLPVDSNYNSNISQNDVPKNSKRFYQNGMQRNGEGFVAQIAEVQQGNVEAVKVEGTSPNFSINSQVRFDNKGTEGSEVEAIVSSVTGQSVNYLESKEDKVVRLTTIQNAYLFADDTLNQPSSGASGSIVGTVKNDNTIVLRNVNGTFDDTGTFSATIKTFTMLLDQRSNYTKGAILSLTDGVNAPIATGEILEGTSSQNVVVIKVLTGTWVVNDDYFLQSSNLFNTSGTKLVRITSLSDNLEPFDVNQSVALIETVEPHGLGVGDRVTVDINPNDVTKTKDYYVRKRLYQQAVLVPPKNKSTINSTGIGRYEILNGGADYTTGTYTSVDLTGGSGSGATATFTVSDAGVISNIQLQDTGSGYERGDYLSVADEDLVRSGASVSTARLTLYVGHVGVPAGGTRVTVDSVLGFAAGDLVKIGNEIVEIESITGNDLLVSRGKEGTEDVDHFDGQEVELYKPTYNFTDNYKIFDGSNSGYIQSYDRDTQTIKIVYDYGTLKSTASKVVLSSTFFDSSTPQRLVSINTATEIEYKFEFSTDNTNFTANPNIDLQEFYKYKFDTSHSSLTGTYFDISPSNNYNLITVEKVESLILPGNPGSFTDVKFGFGSRLSDNNYQTKVGTDFTNFYYFDKKNVVLSDGAYFRIVTDPLQGVKEVNYVTPNRFVYDVPSDPLWDGSGTISYTTTGQFAIGKINTVGIVNLGLNYKKVPVIVGADPTTSYRATAKVVFDEDSQVITGVEVTNKGKNYSNPKVFVLDADGADAIFKVLVRNGEVSFITVESPGKGYTYAPEIIIVEGDVDAYVESTSIGVPRSVNITTNGGAFHLDKTVASTFNSNYIAALTNFNGDFRIGEEVIQKIDNNIVFKATVAEWRLGSNLIKLKNTTGTIREGINIQSALTTITGNVKSVFVSTFSEEINSFYDNLGYYSSDRGKLGVSNQKITDSFFYQDYSYVIKSQTSIEQWRDLIKSTTHPAGFKLFGQVDVEGTASSEMPVEMPKSSHYSVIQLWDPEKNKITSDIKQRVVTQSIQKVENTRINKAVGTAAPSEFLFNEVRAFEFTLAAPFDGYYDTNGRLQGTTTFQIISDLGVPFFPSSDKGLIVTLDGILQEPGVSYTINSDTIVFSAPPLGDGTKNGSAYKGVTFYGKVFQFKDDQYNTKHLRKLKNIFQRSGTWIDAANQIERNAEFIINETIGYGKATYPTLDWATKQDDYERNIRAILDAYDHDIRFGGNIKTVNYASIFNQDDDYLYIQNNKTQSTNIFAYASRLAKLAIRNWDYIDIGVSYIQGSKTMNVSSTENVAVGMFVSSGRSYPEGTKIVSIDSATQLTLSNSALANSGGGGGVPDGITDISGTAPAGNTTLPTNTGRVVDGETYDIPDGSSLYVATSFSGSDQASFSWSGLSKGMFYKGGELIALNKTDIITQSLAWAQAQYPSLNWGTIETKCGRDLGLIIDAYVYHLQFGGNERIVEAARLYFKKEQYPYGETLSYVSDTLTETLATFAYARNLMITAMKNQGAVTDPDVLVDSVSPVCAEVESALQTFHSILDSVLSGGPGLVSITKENPNKRGNWTPTLTYSNYNIIFDPLLPAQECVTVVSAIDSLYDNLDDVLKEESVTKALPDYVDGETKEFELYWDDGSEVNTEEDEDLFLTINAVLQRPKYTESYPGEDSYFIDRTVIPNLIKFDVAPIWDQDLGAKTIGEPSAVEKVVGIGVGNYKRLTIDYNLVDGVRNGPFLILDVEDYTVQGVEAHDALYVFLDGVLQRKGYSYEVAGPNITFNVPIKKEMKVDIRYLYGRDVGQVLNIYDYAPDTYFTQGVFTFDSTPTILDEYFKYTWMGDSIGSTIHVWQQRANGTYNVIGELSNPFKSGNTVTYNLKSQNAAIESGLDYTFAVKGRYSRNYIIADGDISNVSITFTKDEVGRKLLRDDNALWFGTFFRKTYKNPFVYLTKGDKIRVEGEEGFREIKQLPEEATSKEGRTGKPTTNDIFGNVKIESYTGVTRGEGLSVVATIDGNGSITKLTWNQRSYDPITQPTAYQYFTPPVLKFEPVDGNGGGAKANVLVGRKGEVLSVDLIDGGSGYTIAPKVITTRRFDILSERGVGVSLINLRVNPVIETSGMTAISTIQILGNRLVDAFSFSSIDLLSPKDISKKIEAEIQTGVTNILDGSSDGTMPVGDQLISPNDSTEIVYIEPEPVQVDGEGGVLRLQGSETVVKAEVQDIISANTISSVTKVITATTQIDIPNNAISNINYFENAAYLDLDFNIGDSIVYIPDTSKFYGTGLLLVGDEVVSYARKLNDRFLYITRARKGTTEQNWTAGTFLRQIPELVSVAPVGIAKIESESQLVAVSVGAEATGRTEKKSQYQVAVENQIDVIHSATVITAEVQPEVISTLFTSLVTESISTIPFESVSSVSNIHYIASPVDVHLQVITSKFEITKTALEVLLVTPPSGIIDGYVETVFFTNPIETRNIGFVTLVEETVTQRNGNIVETVNAVLGADSGYIGEYTPGNIGHTISHFEGMFDDGSAGVSGLSLENIDTYFPSLTLRDFTDRRNSSFTISGDRFNLMPPSIQDPVAISSSTGTISGNIVVQSTTYFRDDGYLFTSGGTVIKYTGKTQTEFTGCTVYSGPTSITAADVLVPYTI